MKPRHGSTHNVRVQHHCRFARAGHESGQGVAVGLLLAAILVALTCGFASAWAVDSVGGIPVEDTAEAAQQVPSVGMAVGILVTDDGRELWARDADLPHSMASTTKIMTAVVVLENASLDESVSVSSSAISVGESAAGLRAGDVASVSEMLEALLVKSGNEAAVALAEHVAGTEPDFVRMMNEKAKQLGLDNTNYTNAHGLDEQGHHTSARDLAVLSRYAMGNATFAQIVAQPTATVQTARDTRTVENSNYLIGRYKGATGVKTGWTNDAGYCLVASAERAGVGLTAVVLGADSEMSRFVQAEELLDWGFEHYGLRRLASADDTMGLVPVADYLDIDVTALITTDVVAPVFDLDGELTREITLEPEVRAPVATGQRIGTLSIAQGERLLAQEPIVAGETVPEPGFLEKIWIAVRRAWRVIFGEPAAVAAPA